MDKEKGKERKKMKVDVHWFEGKLIGFEMIKYGQPAEMYQGFTSIKKRSQLNLKYQTEKEQKKQLYSTTVFMIESDQCLLNQ